MKNNTANSIKFFIVSILCFSFSFLFGQEVNMEDRVKRLNSVDSIINNYLKNSALSKQPGLKNRDEKMFIEYKSLFTNNALIFDDINAEYDPTAKGFPYVLKEKTKDEYFDGLVENFSKGLVISNKSLNIGYETFKNNVVQFALERQIEGVNFEGYHFQNHDTLLITIYMEENVSKISKVQRLGSKLTVVNDNDLDGVINEKDNCPDTKGKKSLDGCPDKDNDGIIDEKDGCPDLAGPLTNDGCPESTFSYRTVFSASGGFLANNINLTKMPDLSQVGYSNLFKSVSNSGKIDRLKPFSFGGALSADIAFYFGKNKQSRNKGISIGVIATSFKSSFNITEAKYVFQSNDGESDYRRIITLVSDTETVNFNILNFPLMFKYKGRFGQKWAYELSAGPSFLLISGSSYQQATFNIEGVYGSNKVLEDNYVQDKSDWLLTDAAITKSKGNTQDLFDKLYNSNSQELIDAGKGYDFKMNDRISTTEKTKISSRTSFAFNAAADVFYHIGPKTAIKGGFVFYTAPSVSNSNADKYQMVDKSSRYNGKYNSVFNSQAKLNYSAFGLFVGLILGI